MAMQCGEECEMKLSISAPTIPYDDSHDLICNNHLENSVR